MIERQRISPQDVSQWIDEASQQACSLIERSESYCPELEHPLWRLGMQLSHMKYIVAVFAAEKEDQKLQAVKILHELEKSEVIEDVLKHMGACKTLPIRVRKAADPSVGQPETSQINGFKSWLRLLREYVINPL